MGAGSLVVSAIARRVVQPGPGAAIPIALAGAVLAAVVALGAGALKAALDDRARDERIAANIAAIEARSRGISLDARIVQSATTAGPDGPTVTELVLEIRLASEREIVFDPSFRPSLPMGYTVLATAGDGSTWIVDTLPDLGDRLVAGSGQTFEVMLRPSLPDEPSRPEGWIASFHTFEDDGEIAVESIQFDIPVD